MITLNYRTIVSEATNTTLISKRAKSAGSHADAASNPHKQPQGAQKQKERLRILLVKRLPLQSPTSTRGSNRMNFTLW